MSKSVTYKGKVIHYSSHGEGPAIIMLHGFTESMEIWKNFTRKLLRSFRVITIDLPGHGRSEVLDKVHSMDLMAESVNHILKELDVTTCLMVGHSMGGYVALAFAEKFRRKIKGIVLFHSQAGADSAETRANRERTIELVEKDRKGFIRDFIPDLFDPANRKKYRDEIESLKILSLQMPKEAIIAAIEGMKIRPDRTHVLLQSKFPILFIIGKNDSRIPMELVLPQTTLPAHSEMLLLDNVGHMGFIEAPAVTYEAVRAFAERVL